MLRLLKIHPKSTLYFFYTFYFVLEYVPHAQSLSHVRLCNPVDYIAGQAPLSMEFPRQEYWSGLPFPPPI